tara:strand:+ start:4269 stop:5207 length:939 start_codon:yes stop_codon:yes gene_type:complete
MRVAVTGGAGFIGGHVVDALTDRGHTPIVFDHRGRGDADVMLGDCRDEVAVTEMAAHVDAIIHLASVLGTQETVANPRPAVLTNVAAGLNVFEAAAQYGLPVVNISVGNTGHANPYSASKTCVETLGQMFINDRGLRLNQVRPVNAYGPRQSVSAPYGSAKVRKIMPSFICRALTGQPIEVYGDGEQVSDCVYVTDVASVLVTALESAAQGNVSAEVIEVGPAAHHTVNEIAELVRAEVSTYTDRLAPITHLPMRPGETPGAVVTADTATLHRVGVDAAEFVGLPLGIAAAVDWFVRHEGVTWTNPASNAAK